MGEVDIMEFHETANIFPMMDEDALTELANDIRANGLLEPITTYEGKILDGRNRYIACHMAEVEPRFESYIGDDPICYIISMNLKRRHLNESQRAMIGARLANMPSGARTDLAQICARSQEQAAEMMGVSRRSVQSAHSVQQDGIPELIALVNGGNIAVSQAAKIAKLSEEAQQTVVTIIVDEEIRPQEAIRRAKAESFAQREAAMPSGKYRIIYADPPWHYQDKLTEDYGPALHHYPSMRLQELCELPIEEIASDNAVLFLWATSPMLEDVFEVIRAWGFEYKTSFIWDKVRHNFGHYNSVRHEFLLICTRGSCTPDVAKLFDSVQTIERSDVHSEKPEQFRNIIDTLYPHGNRIELFARKAVDGWTSWGNESPT